MRRRRPSPRGWGKTMLIEDETPALETECDPCGVVDRPVDHILVIDDDLTQSEILLHRFSSQGYRVSLAHSCDAGIDVALADHPDLILLDIGLPDGDGLEVCSRLSDGERTSDIPVIIVSGMDQPDVVRRARAAGCRYYVRKPYDPNALLVLSRNAIAESRDW